MKIIYYECDRCKKRINNFKEIAMVLFIGKQKELCKECQDSFKKWLKSSDKEESK